MIIRGGLHPWTLLWGIALGLLLSVTSPPGHTTGCEGVEVEKKTDLSLGTLRTRPGAHGFLELHPRNGVAATGSGLVHQGPSGVAVVRVAGVPGSRVTLAIDVAARTDHDKHYLRLVELIIRTREEQTRFPADHATITLTLPDEKSPQGLAVSEFRIGAVVRYRHVSGGTALRYRLRTRCMEID
ncbi:hypothetical protein [Spiribacter sp. SSL99]|uniref:hypothetical protein n=1 Tax=Spiribacter sp. SSL99 TaxID=1866884 RepID=UPI00133035C6|nr:hypothetical protein [Spiribacter sp. SSL99]